MPIDPRPMPEEQPVLLEIEPPPITPTEVIRLRRGRGRGKIGKHHKWLAGKIQQHGPELVERLLAEALAGDMIAMKLCLERGWGLPMRAAAPVDLPATSNAAEVQAAMHALLARITAGEVDTATGADLMTICRNLLAAHVMIDGTGLVPVRNGTETDSRNLLADRLARVIDARRANGNGNGKGLREESFCQPPAGNLQQTVANSEGSPDEKRSHVATVSDDDEEISEAEEEEILRRAMEEYR